MVRFNGVQKRAEQVIIHRVHDRALLNEVLGHLNVARISRNAQSGLPDPALHVYVDPILFQQGHDHAELSESNAVMENREPLRAQLIKRYHLTITE